MLAHISDDADIAPLTHLPALKRLILDHCSPAIDTGALAARGVQVTTR